MSEPQTPPTPPTSDPGREVKEQSREFIERARTGTLDESNLKWGLSAGAVIAFVSLFFNYASWGNSNEVVWIHNSVSGWDLLSAHIGSLDGISALAIPLSALFGLYLHFGEPSMKFLKMDTPGRPKLIYLIGMIVAALGVIGCIRIISHQVCLGNVMGLIGLGLLAFVYINLWNRAPAA